MTNSLWKPYTGIGAVPSGLVEVEIGDRPMLLVSGRLVD